MEAGNQMRKQQWRMDSGGDVACSRQGRSVVVGNDAGWMTGKAMANADAKAGAGNGAGESFTFCCPS